MADNGASSSRQGQVQVHFITNSPDIELPEGKRQLLVPTSKEPPVGIIYKLTDGMQM